MNNIQTRTSSINPHLLTFLVVFSVIGSISLGRPYAQSETTTASQIISATNPNIRYVNRFDFRDPAGSRCEWSASTVELRFTGPYLNAKINDSGDGDAFNLSVDNEKPTVLTLHKGTADYTLLADTGNKSLRQVHKIRLVKRTEAYVGMAQFLSFELPTSQKLLTLPAAGIHRLEVIGDSISCGFGDEATSKDEHFSPSTENADAAYGALAAHAFDADYTAIAWSGRKMWPDSTVPSIYGFALPTDTASTWDYSSNIPDAIVINLSTNDFGHGNPDRIGWTNAYELFINRLRGYYPKAMIYITTSPMMSDSYPPGQMALTTLNSYLAQIQQDEQKVGDVNVRILNFETQNPANGYGADWHPNLKTHALMAAKLEQALITDCGWKKQNPAN